MATDYWPSNEGLIVPGLDIGFFLAAATVTEGKPVKLATGTAGYIKCQNGAALGDACAVALKSADANEYVPVAMSGVMKVVVDGNTPQAITTGHFLMNSALIVIEPNINDGATDLVVFGGSSYVLGMALQPSSAANDEILMVLGKVM